MSEGIPRLLTLPERSFFLFGPRGVGKSFWLRRQLKDAVAFDLLNTGLQIEFGRDPHQLEARVGPRAAGTWVWIDEIQKVPALLDEVHRLMESRRWRFALSGSSARKLLRSGANLLGGRASTRRMEAFSWKELGPRFDLARSLEWGALPLVVNEPEHARDILTAYVHTYIREEVKEEGLVRKIEPFLRFIDVAGTLNGQELNAENVAREAMIPRSSVISYFSILEDTLVAHRLPAYRPRAKVREQAHARLYWFDAGVARAAAGLLHETVDSEWRGRALETQLFHEIRVYNHVSGRERPITYYRTRAGAEIDFVIELSSASSSRRARVVCIEVKSALKWNRKWGLPMCGLAATGKVQVDRMIGVYRGAARMHFDGVEVLGVTDFLEDLFAGKIF